MKEFITVAEYARRKPCSTQYIYDRIKQNKLEYKVQDGKKLVVNDLPDPMQTSSQSDANDAGNSIDNDFLMWLQTEVARLTKRVEYLEDELVKAKTDGLNKVIDLQARKDKQLQDIIELMQNRLPAPAPVEEKEKEDDFHDAEIIDAAAKEVPVKLSTYLKERGVNKEKREKITKRAQDAFYKDSTRFAIFDRKLYVYPSEDYSDIL